MNLPGEAFPPSVVNLLLEEGQRWQVDRIAFVKPSEQALFQLSPTRGLEKQAWLML